MLVKPSIMPGHHPNLSDIRLTGELPVSSVAFSKNGPPPIISQYIAYDSLTPPNPFLAVTQDGTGNVVYDGGFPKFYNQRAPAASVSSFSDLPASFKFLYNAINFCANKGKVASGNRKILIIGDAPINRNYAVRSTANNGFNTSFNRVCALVGFEPTYMDVDDWGGSTIDISLAELDKYALVLFMSSWSSTIARVTDSATANFVTYRQNGNGIIFVTDHGPILESLEEATTNTGSGFFKTANKITVNFGAWFSGDYDRSPVNVGFIRDNYGDHPLYAGMADSESIFAGGSESEVILNEVTSYSRDNIPLVTMENNPYTMTNVLSISVDGALENSRYLYTTGSDAMFSIKTKDGRINQTNIRTSKRHLDIEILVNLIGFGTIDIDLYSGSSYIGNAVVTDTSCDITWINNPQSSLILDDVLVLDVKSPFIYRQEFNIVRIPNPTGNKLVPKLYLTDTDFIPGSEISYPIIRDFVNKVIDSDMKIGSPADYFTKLQGYVNDNNEYGPIRGYIVDSFDEVITRNLSHDNHLPVVNRVTREVLVPSTDGWKYIDDSLTNVFGHRRRIVDVDTNITWLISSGDGKEPRNSGSFIYRDLDIFGYAVRRGDSTLTNSMPVSIENGGWIWDRNDAHLSTVPAGDMNLFIKRFYSPYAGKANLHLVVDNNLNRCEVNGRIYVIGDSGTTTIRSVEVDLFQGINTIYLVTQNQGNGINAAGVLAMIERNGDIVVNTDSTWSRFSSPSDRAKTLRMNNDAVRYLPYDVNHMLDIDESFEIELDWRSEVETANATTGFLLAIGDIMGSNITSGVGLSWVKLDGISRLRVTIANDRVNTDPKRMMYVVDQATSTDTYIDITDNRMHRIKVVYSGNRRWQGIRIWIDGIQQGRTNIGPDNDEVKWDDTRIYQDGALTSIGGRNGDGGSTTVQQSGGWFANILVTKKNKQIINLPLNEGSGTAYNRGAYPSTLMGGSLPWFNRINTLPSRVIEFDWRSTFIYSSIRYEMLTDGNPTKQSNVPGVTFNGSTDRVRFIPRPGEPSLNYLFDENNSMSLSMWVRPRDTHRFLCAGRFHIDIMRVRLRGDGEGQLLTGIDNSAGLDKWYNFVVTYNSENRWMSLYVNGRLTDELFIGDRALMSGYQYSALMMGGTTHISNPYADCDISTFRIYPLTLTVHEVLADFNDRKEGFGIYELGRGNSFVGRPMSAEFANQDPIYTDEGGGRDEDHGGGNDSDPSDWELPEDGISN